MSQNGFAFCSLPTLYVSAPSSPLLIKPSAPYCLSNFKYTKKHNCSQFEIDNYISSVKSYLKNMSEYNNAVSDYSKNVATYSQEITEYTQCKSKEIIAELQ